MHLDEVECVIGELIGHLVPLHGWSASTVARPVNGVEEEEVGWWERGRRRGEDGEWMKKKLNGTKSTK